MIKIIEKFITRLIVGLWVIITASLFIGMLCGVIFLLAKYI